MTAKDFQSACHEAISGWLWDDSFSRLYTEKVSLGICEMREIVNALRKAEGLPPMQMAPFSEEAADADAESLKRGKQP